MWLNSVKQQTEYHNMSQGRKHLYCKGCRPNLIQISLAPSSKFRMNAHWLATIHPPTPIDTQILDPRTLRIPPATSPHASNLSASRSVKTVNESSKVKDRAAILNIQLPALIGLVERNMSVGQATNGQSELRFVCRSAILKTVKELRDLWVSSRGHVCLAEERVGQMRKDRIWEEEQRWGNLGTENGLIGW